MTRLVDAFKEADLDPADSLGQGLEKILRVERCRSALLQMLYPDAKALLLSNDRLVGMARNMREHSANAHAESSKSSRELVDLKTLHGAYRKLASREHELACRLLSTAKIKTVECDDAKKREKALGLQLRDLQDKLLGANDALLREKDSAAVLASRTKSEVEALNCQLNMLRADAKCTEDALLTKNASLTERDGVLKADKEKLAAENSELREQLAKAMRSVDDACLQNRELSESMRTGLNLLKSSQERLHRLNEGLLSAETRVQGSVVLNARMKDELQELKKAELMAVDERQELTRQISGLEASSAKSRDELDAAKRYSQEIYKANLSLKEALDMRLETIGKLEAKVQEVDTKHARSVSCVARSLAVLRRAHSSSTTLYCESRSLKQEMQKQREAILGLETRSSSLEDENLTVKASKEEVLLRLLRSIEVVKERDSECKSLVARSNSLKNELYSKGAQLAILRARFQSASNRFADLNEGLKALAKESRSSIDLLAETVLQRTRRLHEADGNFRLALSVIRRSKTEIDELSKLIHDSNCREREIWRQRAKGQVLSKTMIEKLQEFVFAFKRHTQSQQSRIKALAVEKAEAEAEMARYTSELQQMTTKFSEARQKVKELENQRLQDRIVMRDNSKRLKENVVRPCKEKNSEIEQKVMLLYSNAKKLLGLLHKLNQQNQSLQMRLVSSRTLICDSEKKRHDLEILWKDRCNEACRTCGNMLKRAKEHIASISDQGARDVDRFKSACHVALGEKEAMYKRRSEVAVSEKSALVRMLGESVDRLRSGQADLARISGGQSRLNNVLKMRIDGQNRHHSSILTGIKSVLEELEESMVQLKIGSSQQSANNLTVMDYLHFSRMQIGHLKSILCSYRKRLVFARLLLDSALNENGQLKETIMTIKCRSTEAYTSELERRVTLLTGQLAEANTRSADMFDLLKIKLEQDVTGRVTKSQAETEVHILKKMFAL